MDKLCWKTAKTWNRNRSTYRIIVSIYIAPLNIGNGKTQLVLDVSVFLTLHGGGEGQNVYRINFPAKVVTSDPNLLSIVTNFNDTGCHNFVESRVW